MLRVLAHAAGALLVVLALPGCGGGCGPGGDPTPAEPESCFDEILPDGGLPAATFELGEGDATSFVAYPEFGAQAEILKGGQGGYMILPSVRITTLPAGTLPVGDPVCVQVRVGNMLADGTAVQPLTVFQIQFEHDGTSGLFGGPLFDLLGYDEPGLTGHTLMLSVDVIGRGFGGHASATVLLTNDVGAGS